MDSFKTLLRKIFSKGHQTSHGDEGVKQDMVTLKLDCAGLLSRKLTQGKEDISRMKLVGDLDSTDVKLLRSLPRLEALDLSEARIVVGGDYYIKNLYCQNENDTMGLYMFHRCTHLKTIIFPRAVKVVRAFAFRRCMALSEVHFSDVLEQIGERAFSYCASLQAVQFPASLKSIREMAFMHCKMLKSVELPDSVKSIGFCAFGDCPALISVSLSSSLQNLDSEVFRDCVRLGSIHAKGMVPAFAKSDTFDGVEKDKCILYVPKGTKEMYSTANGWKVFKHIVEE